MTKTILQGTVKGARRRGRQKKRWEDNIKEWTGKGFGDSLRVVEDRKGWKAIVATSSLVPRWPPRLRDWDEIISRMKELPFLILLLPTVMQSPLWSIVVYWNYVKGSCGVQVQLKQIKYMSLYIASGGPLSPPWKPPIKVWAQEFEFLSIVHETGLKKAISDQRVWKTRFAY